MNTTSSPRIKSAQTRLAVLFLSIALIASLKSVSAQTPPGPDFKLLLYNGVAAAYTIGGNCKPASHVAEVMYVTLDVGKVIDTSYQQSPIPCCGGPENHNSAVTSVPPGFYVLPSYKGDGEGGIFNLSPSQAETTNTSHQKVLVVHLNIMDLYAAGPCGPTSTAATTYLNAWVKQRDAPPSAPSAPQILSAWPRTYRVTKGDCLAKIAERTYGSQVWSKIYHANHAEIKDPNLIFPEERLVLPAP